MNALRSQKIKVGHLSRNAYLYIRQSTLKQVYENSESTKRQYALKQQAVSLGWLLDNIITIDSDLGQSGTASAERGGFQKLVAEVGMGKAGIVIGLEVSRLSRSSADWSRLLEICAITDTLIMDEDGVYDTNDFNDRLLLGLKGTMSEAELHFLKARMRGGLINKAKRGELKRPIPVGYVYDDNDRIIFDSDEQVQQAIRHFFDTFKRVGSAWSAMKEYNKQGLKFPLRLHQDFKRGDVHWVQLIYSRVIHILHNPIYAGVYYYGETQVQRTVKGKKNLVMPRDQWHTFIPDSHPGYITLEEFERNLGILKENSHKRDEAARKTPPREGSALLQGIAVCGICGTRMTVRYRTNSPGIIPIYECHKRNKEYGESECQTVRGNVIDAKISELLLEMVNPLAIEAALGIQKELMNRKNDIDKLYQQQVERARYEMELAKRRYMNVDPDNRLVAGLLEAEWNKKLKALEEAGENYEKQRQTQIEVIDEKVRSDIRNIAQRFPKIWNDKNVSAREKKRMVRCLIEDVTITQGQEITLSIRFKGGTIRILNIPKPVPGWQSWTTRPDIVEEIDRLLNYCIPDEIAAILNDRGIKSGKGKAFTKRIVEEIAREYNLKRRYNRLKEAGFLTLTQKMKEMNMTKREIQRLRKSSMIHFHRFCDGDHFMYEPT